MKTIQPEPLCVPIETTQALLGGVSRASIYRRAKDKGGLELIKIGGRTMITMASIRRQVGVAA
jgi:hypothetical protein